MLFRLAMQLLLVGCLFASPLIRADHNDAHKLQIFLERLNEELQAIQRQQELRKQKQYKFDTDNPDGYEPQPRNQDRQPAPVYVPPIIIDSGAPPEEDTNRGYGVLGQD